MSTQVCTPQSSLLQDAFITDAFDFSFMDSQHSISSDLPTDLPNTFELSNFPNVEIDEHLMNMGSNLTLEEIQQMIDSFSVSLAALPQGTQPTLAETPYTQQEATAQIHTSPANVLPQPPAVVPSQAPIASQSATPTPEQPQPTPTASGSQTPREDMLLKAITLLKLNMRFNPLFQKLNLVSCPNKIDLKAGMEREDAMVAAGYLPQTHIPWEQALKLLGKQGFRAYHFSEIKKAKANNIELPPVPEWIIRYCFGKRPGNKPAATNNTQKHPTGNPTFAKVLLARNNPTRRSKAAAASRKDKGKGKAVDTQRYNPYTRH